MDREKLRIYDRNDPKQKNFRVMCDRLEKEGSITKVGPKYYKEFSELSEKQLECMIVYIIVDRMDGLNKKLSSKTPVSDGEIYEYIMDFLELIAYGIIQFAKPKEENEYPILCFSAPVGELPDKDMTQKLDAKVKSALPIIEKVMWKIIEAQSEKGKIS